MIATMRAICSWRCCISCRAIPRRCPAREREGPLGRFVTIRYTRVEWRLQGNGPLGALRFEQSRPRSTPMATPTAIAHSHLALQPFVTETQHSGLEQRLAQASLRRVEAKEFVFAEGDPTTHIFQVETGAGALYKVLCDGRRQVVGFAYPGDLIGLGAEGEHVMNAQAIKPTRL